jgi:regulator of RNase E activity RraA
VVDGACRDVSEALGVRLAVYARGPVAVTARGRVLEQTWGEPVRIAGTTVCSGDLVIADASGVAFVPQAAAEEVLETAMEIAAREASMSAALRRGIPVSAVMGGDYETLMAPIARDE